MFLVQKQGYARFVSLMCIKFLFFGCECEYQGGVSPIIRDMSAHAELKMKIEQVFLFCGFALIPLIKRRLSLLVQWIDAASGNREAFPP